MLLRIAAFLLLSTTFLTAADKVRVVSFSTILTEIAGKVGGESAEVIGLVKPGVDPHEYQPNPEDLQMVAKADLILLAAKHMEGYVGKLKESTGTKGTLVEVGDRFPSLKMKADDDHDHKDAKGHKHEGETIEDPHWWHSIQNIRRATKVVQDELTKRAPEGKAEFAERAAAYGRELDKLEAWAKTEIAKIPRNQRKLVTTHDAFQYFARDYGFTVYPIEGVSPEDQPSSRKVADLITTIRKQRVKAVFLESTGNPKVSTEITKESGAKIGGTLYADGLVEGDGSTYAGMFRHNVTTIVNGLLQKE